MMLKRAETRFLLLSKSLDREEGAREIDEGAQHPIPLAVGVKERSL
jgi:hypothetical protein